MLVPALLLAAVFAGSVSVAFADVDPASDVLLLQNVFVPYQPPVCSQLKDQLKSLTDKTDRAGYPLKVAVIGSRNDLGGAPQYFGRPADYAKFLGQELAVFGPDVGKNLASVPLLVVMPQGFGFYSVDLQAGQAGETVKVPPKASPNELARAAILAIPKIATTAGHPIGAVQPASSCSNSGTNVLVFAAPIAVLIIAGLLLRYGLRPRRPAQAADSQSEPDA